MQSLGATRAAVRPGLAPENEVVHTTDPTSTEKNGTTASDDAVSPDTPHGEPTTEQDEKDVVPTETAQRGVQQVEAITLTWTKPNLILVFIL